MKWLGRTKRSVLWSAAVAALVALGALGANGWLQHAARRDARASFYSNFEDLPLTDQRGRSFRFPQLLGKVVLLNFIFTTCPTICPMQTDNLARALAALTNAERASVHFVSMSIDPEHDTPQALRDFAVRHHVDTLPWSFVRSSSEGLDRLQRRLALFSDASDEARPNGHNTTLWLVDRDGRLLQQYHGASPDSARISRELRTLLSL